MGLPPPTPDERADDVVGRLRERMEDGEAVDLDAVLEEHAELAEHLRPRIAMLRLLGAAYGDALRSGSAIAAAPVVPGQRIGPYRLGRALGRGGMGTVFLARVSEPHDGLEAGREVALKVVHPHLASRRDLIERFRREARIGRRVRHENVVSTLAAGSLERPKGAPLLYLVMELVQGRTLRELAEDMHKLSEPLLREIGRQTAEGLSAIHAEGVVHRDLKPENVVVTTDQRVRIMDLGVARLVDATVALTQEGQFAGSLLYAAPEQLRGEEVGPAADLYTLGLLLYELASGSLPFTATEIAAGARGDVAPAAPPLTDVQADVTPFFAQVVKTLLAPHPMDRFPSARIVADVLREGEGSAWWSRALAAPPELRASRARIPVAGKNPFRGRQAEARALATAWGPARAGHGAVLLVTGEEGVGKTRLLDAFLRDSVEPAAQVLYGSFASGGGLSGVAEALQGRFGVAQVEEHVRRYLRASPGLASVVARLVRGEHLAGTEVESLHPALVRLARGLASERPLVWILEDLDAASEAGLGLILSLARATEAQAMLLLLTAGERLGEAELEPLTRLGRFTRLPLGRLAPAEIQEILEDLLEGAALRRRLGHALLERADGVPYFLMELLRDLEGRGALCRTPEGTYEPGPGSVAASVPPNLRQLMRGRLRRLSEEQQLLVDLAAVQGYTFDAYRLADALERPPIGVLRELAAIERRDGVVRATGRRHQFDHRLLWEVVYEDLAPELRAEYHTRVAEAGRPSSAPDAAQGPSAGEDALFRASHHLKGARPRDALGHLEGALEHLDLGSRHEEVVELCRRALERPALLEGTLRRRVLLQLGSSLQHLGRASEAGPAYEEALALAEEARDDETVFACLLGRVRLAISSGRWEEAAAALDRASRMELAAESAPSHGEIESLKGRLAQHLARPEDARRHYERALDLAVARADVSAEIRARSDLGRLLAQDQDLETARQHHERCITLARGLGDALAEAEATSHLGLALFRLGRTEESKVCHERALAIARERGDRRREAEACGNLGNVCLRQGDLEQARQWHEQDLEIARERGEAGEELDALNNLGNVWLLLGRHEEAAQIYRRVLDVADRHGRRSLVPAAWANLAMVAYDRGALMEMEACLEQTISTARAVRRDVFALHHLTNRAWLHTLWGDFEGAGDMLAQVDEACSTRPVGRTLGYVRYAQARLAEATGDEDGADRLYAEALSLHRAANEGPGVADTQIALGRRALAAGRAAEAGGRLREAYELARDRALWEQTLLAAVHGARLPGASRADARRLTLELGERAGVLARLEAALVFWELERDPADARTARVLLDQVLAGTPSCWHETMRRRVPVLRDVAAIPETTPAPPSS